MKKLNRVASHHGVALVRGDVDESLVDDPARFRPIAGGMGEVAAPKERIDADIVAQAHAERIFHEAPKAILLEIEAGFFLERFDAPIPLGPIDFQSRETLEETGEC